MEVEVFIHLLQSMTEMAVIIPVYLGLLSVVVVPVILIWASFYK